MDCHAAARGLIPSGNGVHRKKRASRPLQETVNGVPSLNDYSFVTICNFAFVLCLFLLKYL